MKYLGTLTAIVLITICTVCLAQAMDVDWKAYGGLSPDGGSVCFYDAKGIARTPDGHMRVWTKCLPKKDIDSIDIKKDFDGKVLENTAQKVADHYMPPIATVETLNADQIMPITEAEIVADIVNIEPRAKIFYELNCPERKMRELSIYIAADGKTGSSDKTSNWHNIPPEGNGSTLLKILCLRQ